MKRPVKRHEVIQPLDKPYRFIPLTRNQNAIVDAEDFEHLSQWNWYAVFYKSTQSFYANRWTTTKEQSEGFSTALKMHRDIVKCSPEEECDHKDFDTLNNRKSNLRKCTGEQNRRHRRDFRNNTSGFKGVNFHKWKCKWVARIGVHGKRVSLGYRDTPEEASKLYNEAVKKFYKEFAYLG